MPVALQSSRPETVEEEVFALPLSCTFSETYVTVKVHTPDPGTAHKNQYVAFGNNPVNVVDPDGLAPQLIGIGPNGMPIYSGDRDWGDYDSRWGGRGAGAGARRNSGVTFAGGTAVSGSWINPATSRGGAVVGLNRMPIFRDDTTCDFGYDSFDRGGLGLDVGVGAESVWAWGRGPWAGDFDSVAISLGPIPLVGSYFWSPDGGGWRGFTFGVGFGLPGIAYEGTTYFPLDPSQNPYNQDK